MGVNGRHLIAGSICGSRSIETQRILSVRAPVKLIGLGEMAEAGPGAATMDGLDWLEASDSAWVLAWSS
jgi:hypothetical protein